MINNSELSEIEHVWLEALLEEDFSARDGIIRQINNSEIVREYTPGYLSMRFHVNMSEAPVNVNMRVPVEMLAFMDKENPTHFMLHIIDGYVNELEIYNTDLSEINPDLDISRVRVVVAHDRPVGVWDISTDK